MRFPDLSYEIRHGFPERKIVGVDEVGRGCIAGPVVAGAVLLPRHIDFKKNAWAQEIKDSKQLTLSARERLEPMIKNWCQAYGIGLATVDEIDQWNIHHASHLALVRAIQSLCSSQLKFKRRGLSGQPKIHHVLVDGKFLPKNHFSFSGSAVIKGDEKCLSIASASILAKVWRDRLMDRIAIEHPDYGFERHKGYATQVHLAAIKSLGLLKYHRKTFCQKSLDLQTSFSFDPLIGENEESLLLKSQL